MIIVILLPALISSGQISKGAADAMPSFSVHLSAQNTTVKIGEPLYLTASLVNVSDNDLQIYKIHGQAGERIYDIHVADEQGQEAPLTSYGRYLRGKRLTDDPMYGPITSAEYVNVAPKEKDDTGLSVGRVFDIKNSGIYTIWVERYDAASHSKIKSNTISVTVYS